MERIELSRNRSDSVLDDDDDDDTLNNTKYSNVECRWRKVCDVLETQSSIQSIRFGVNIWKKECVNKPRQNER